MRFKQQLEAEEQAAKALQSSDEGGSDDDDEDEEEDMWKSDEGESEIEYPVKKNAQTTKAATRKAYGLRGLGERKRR
jgi:hypothetical protein